MKQSKTDPFKEGCVLKVGKIKSAACPVKALIMYKSLRGSKTGPFFILSNGQHLTRKHIVLLLKCSLPKSINLNTHSFRIGGASAAAANGVPDAAIKI